MILVYFFLFISFLFLVPLHTGVYFDMGNSLQCSSLMLLSETTGHKNIAIITKVSLRNRT